VLGDDLVATFNGEPMRVSRGGYDVTSRGCYPIAFWFDALPTSVVGVERRLDGSQLVVEDASTSWKIDTTRLFAQDFVLDAAASRIVWNDVAQISTARVAAGCARASTHVMFVPGGNEHHVGRRASASRCHALRGSIDLHRGSRERARLRAGALAVARLPPAHRALPDARVSAARSASASCRG
jgi:hypothetical protein